ncbi:MAG: hypothetical protein E7466_03055, partial [Ruminococcaceae bacterium]|nr:hypothetical protein [Oscillospiraceae bacterium]
MKFISKCLSILMVIAILAGFILIRGAEPAEAATTYYKKYTQVDIIENYNGLTGMQGMAMDDTYIYSVKIATATEDNAFIARTNRATGATTYMTNGKTGTNYFTNLGHANDMEVVTVNGVKNLLVATGFSGSESIVRFTLNGTTLTQAGNYTVVYADNGNQTGASSAQVMRVNGTVLELMIKKNKYLYTATLDTAKTSGEVPITHVFTMDVANMWLDGKVVDTTEWLHQGFEYRDNKIFVPISRYPDMAASAIVVCNVNGAYGTIQNDPNLSFYIETNYEVFEIESCEICPTDGRLYFNTNQSTSSSGNYDSIHYITDYVYDGSNGATESDVYRWETVDGKLKSVTTDGAVFNGLTQTRGNISGYAYTDGRFSMSNGVVLKHNEPWILEWKSSGSWGDGGLLLSKNTKSSSEGNRFIYRRKESTLIALGEYSGGTYYNYGLDLASYGVDGTAEHVYRMTNKIAADGSNMVYLSVDGKELGPMNNYYIAGASQGTKSNWLNGQDFVFSYIGTDSHPIDDCKLEYLQVWGRGALDYVDEPEVFRWESGMSAVAGPGLVANTATKLGGTVSGTSYTDARFNLNQKVVLLHDRPWSVEFKSEGSWSSLLMSSAEHSQVVDAPFLFRNNSNGLLAFGSYDGNQFNNYGIALKSHGIDATAAHTYRLTNRIAADGSNMVYVYVDGTEIGPMNSYFIGGASLQGTSDWISGKDFTFTRMGTVQHDITTTLNYLQVWENGIPTDHTPDRYRWETNSDKLTSITDGYTANTANQLAGTITNGVYSGTYFRLDKPVVLRHDRFWSVEWQSEGSWKDAASGTLLLASALNGNQEHATYLYRRHESQIIAFGERYDGSHQNYGIKLSDHGIDGTAAHTYRLENRVNADGSNMVYLFVDGVELGAMNNHFKAGTAQNTTVNWISGKDFVFSYMGGPNFPMGNCSLGYLQVEEGCVHKFGPWLSSGTSCTTDGSRSRTCSICGFVETEVVPATGHSYK